MTTKHVFANKTFAHLATAIVPGSTTITLVPGDISYILPAFSSGTWLFLVLCDYLNHSEIIKVTAVQGDSLTVERAQGGTSARTWYAGTLIMSRPIAAIFDQVQQKGIFRSGAYNPNGVIAGLYIGEKFYQTGPADAQRRWWMYTNNTGGIGTGDRWRLLAGAPYGGEMEDDDGFHYYAPFWVEYSDPQYWTPTGGVSWDDENGWWDTSTSTWSLTVNGAWADAFRPNDIRLQVLNYEGQLALLEVQDTDLNKIDPVMGDPSYYCHEERKLTFVEPHNLYRIRSTYPTSNGNFRIFFNIGVPWEEFDLAYTDRTGEAYWEPILGSSTYWDTDGWAGPAGYYGIELQTVGTWAEGYRPKSVKFTCDKTAIEYFRIETVSTYAALGDYTGAPRQTTEEFCCGYENHDILKIYMALTEAAKITKIEFGEETWA